MKKIKIYQRISDDYQIYASAKIESSKYLGEVEEGSTFKVLYRDDIAILTSFEADLDDVKFLEEYVEKDFNDQVANAEPEDQGLGCSYWVVELKVERQEDNYWGEEVWTVEYAHEYYYWEKFMQK
jgi:hypothetical protein